MSRFRRTMLCCVILSTGMIARAGLVRLNQTERPPLRRPLASIPLELGDWVGNDEEVDPDIVERAQTTEYLNRIYESRKRPGLRLRLWINYSRRVPTCGTRRRSAFPPEAGPRSNRRAAQSTIHDGR